MHAIYERERTVEGRKLTTFSRDVIHGNAELCPEGGATSMRGCTDRENSTRAFVSLDIAEGDFDIRPLTDGKDQLTGFEISCCGDWESFSLAEAFYFMYLAIMDGMHGAR